MEKGTEGKAAVSPAMKRLGEYLQTTDRRELLQLTVTELSEAAGVSVATVVRLCRALGFRGYSDFRVTLAREGKVWHGEEPRDFMYDIQAEYLAAFARCRGAVDGALLKRAFALILFADKVCCFAAAEHAFAALWLKNRLLEMGVFAVKEEDAQFRNIVIPACGGNDLLITLGGGGEVARAAELARANGMKILSLGGGGQYADCAFCAEPCTDREERLIPLFFAEILCAGLYRAYPERFEVALAKSACAVAGNKL